MFKRERQPASADQDAFLTLEKLTVNYGKIAAVRGLSLNVRRGEVVCLLGRNGAGKSSTLNAVMGLASASGKLWFNGEEITRLATERRVRSGLALAPEGRRVFAGLTVRENLRLGGWRCEAAKLDGQLARLFALFPVLERKLGTRAGFLSGGEQQQLALARALLSEPAVLLLDEPSLGLDPINTRKIFSVLAELKETGMTILLAEQNVARALELADRGYVLAAGRLVLEGPASRLSAQEIERAYLGVTEAGASDGANVAPAARERTPAG